MALDKIKLEPNDSEIWEEALISAIKQEIGAPGVDLVKNRLLEKYGTTIRESFHKWKIIEDILKENFGDGCFRINSKLISEMARSKLKNDHKITQKEIRNNEIINLLGDPEIGSLLNQVLKDSKIIKDIIAIAKVPQTTAYRKIEKLKNSGLLVEDGFIISPTKKKIVKYTCPYSSFTIVHKNGKSFIKYGAKKFLKNKFLTT